MTLIDDREVENWDSHKPGERLDELNRLATEALQEAANLEGQANGLRCKADQYQREAAEIIKYRCSGLKLELPRK